MTNYDVTRDMLTNLQLKKLESAAKKDWKNIRITKKNFQDEGFPHELFLTTRQKTKTANTFANNMSTDIKLSKAQLIKIIQSGRCLGKLLGKLAGALMEVAVPLAIFW